MLRTLSKMMPTQERSSSDEYDMALNDQLCRLAMSLKRFASDRTGNCGPAGRGESASVGSSLGKEGGMMPALLSVTDSAETEVLRDGVGDVRGDAGMGSRWGGWASCSTISSVEDTVSSFGSAQSASE